MFIPQRIIFEKGALNYTIGKEVYDYFKDNKNIQFINMTNNKIRSHIPGDNIYDFYREGKNTLVVGLKKGKKFQSCKPSAHYQLPLLSGCVGNCQYCYLNTNLGEKPYIKIHVNLDDIYEQAQDYMNDRAPEITIFEGSATSDPIPVEPYTHLLRRTIEFFANNPLGRFRFVSKFNDVDSLLDVDHKGKTEARFTINTQKVIDDYEKRTASRNKRIEASIKMMEAGYPVGYIIAPVFMYEGWEEDYRDLLLQLESSLPKNISHPITFEVISHRYTTRAKNIINEVFPDNTLPMSEEDRTYKYGQFGYGKYVYPKEELAYMKEFFKKNLEEIFPDAEIKYII